MSFWKGFLIVLVILVLIFGGIYIYNKKQIDSSSVGDCVNYYMGRGVSKNCLVESKQDSSVIVRCKVDSTLFVGSISPTDSKNCEGLK